MSTHPSAGEVRDPGPVRRAEPGPVPAAGGGPARGAGPRPAREAYFDNARFLAVILVVAGHAWEPLRDHRAVEAAHLLVYAFHLPLFVLVAGHLGGGFARSPAKVRRLVAGLAAPYVFFDIAYPMFAMLAGDRRFVWSPLDPYYLTWFLPALLSWRLSVPLWRQLRRPLLIAVAVTLAAEATTVPAVLAADRAVVLLPFFVLGLAARREHFALLRRRPVRLAAVAVVIAALTGAYVLADTGVDAEWVAWRHGHHETVAPFPVEAAARLLVLVIAGILTAAFLALVPARRLWFTRFGSATLYVYLLHGFVVQGAVFTGWYADGSPPVMAVVATVAAVALAFGLATRPVRGLTRWAVEPRLTLLWKSGTQAGPSGQSGASGASGGARSR